MTTELPTGTPVTFEHRLGKSKVEYVDAVITGYQDGLPCVKTFNGRTYNKVNADRVVPDPEVLEALPESDVEEPEIPAELWPQFPGRKPENIA